MLPLLNINQIKQLGKNAASGWGRPANSGYVWITFFPRQFNIIKLLSETAVLRSLLHSQISSDKIIGADTHQYKRDKQTYISLLEALINNRANKRSDSDTRHLDGHQGPVDMNV